MPTALANPSVVVNNEPVAVVPNSVKFTEGDGEQTMRAASIGGGGVEQVYSDNIETKISNIMFSIFNTVDSINLARAWKKNRNSNVIVVVGTTPDGETLRRTFNRAALLGDYEVPLGSDTQLDLEFKSDASV